MARLLVDRAEVLVAVIVTGHDVIDLVGSRLLADVTDPAVALEDPESGLRPSLRETTST